MVVIKISTMAQVKLTSNLQRYFPKSEVCIDGETVLEVIREMDLMRPGLSHYIVNDRDHLRQHVNIFLDGVVVTDRSNLELSVNKDTEIFIVQALSGG